MVQPTINPDLMGYLHDTPLQVDGINMNKYGFNWRQN